MPYMIVDISDCMSDPCQHGGVCVETPITFGTGYKCVCPSEYDDLDHCQSKFFYNKPFN